MVAPDARYDRKLTRPTVVHTPAELDAVLDTVVGWNAPITVPLLIHGDATEVARMTDYVA